MHGARSPIRPDRRWPARVVLGVGYRHHLPAGRDLTRCCSRTHNNFTAPARVRFGGCAPRTRRTSSDRRRIARPVWPKTVVAGAAAHVHVSAMRKVFGADVITTVSDEATRITLPGGRFVVADSRPDLCKEHRYLFGTPYR